MKTLLSIPLVFCIYFVVNAQTILIDNEDHHISFLLTDQYFEVIIEDKRDNEYNNYYYSAPGKKTNGNEIDSCGTQTLVKKGLENQYSRSYDISLLEFDLNNNGMLEAKVDLGINVRHKFRSNNTEAYPHELPKRYVPPYDREVGGYASKLKDTKITASINWTTSSVLQNGHMIYRYKVPLENILLKHSHLISFRVLVLRTAKEWLGDRPYGTFIYPEQACKYGIDNKFFSIDLFDYPENLFAQKLQQEIKDFELKRNSFSSKNEEYTKRQLGNALKKLPTEDGLYVKMKNGKIIPLERYPANYGATMDYKIRRDFREYYTRLLAPYFTEEDFLNTQIFRIKASDFDSYYIVAAGPLKEVVQWQSLHPMEKVKLESGRLQIIKAPPSSSYLKGASITNENAYVLKNRIPSIKTTPAESWSYHTQLDFPLRPGYYVVWAGGHIWIFEII